MADTSTTNISPPTTGAGSERETRDLRSRAEEQSQAGGAKAGSAAQRVREAAKETSEAAKSSAQALAERAKHEVGEAAEKAGAQGRHLLDEQKARVASELHAYSDAARRAASRLENESDTNLSHYLISAAERVDALSTHLHDSRISDLVDEVEEMARRRPEVFYGAMFVAGLAAARFVKASRRRRMQDRVESAASEREPSPSDYFETQPVTDPGPLYPPPATPGVPAGGTQAATSANPVTGGGARHG